jgi:uncharacterized SAM-binding protein YcdF (DUF218 family)
MGGTWQGEKAEVPSTLGRGGKTGQKAGAFIASKVFWLLAQPLSIVLLLLLLAFLLVLQNRKRLALAALLLGFLVHGLVGFTNLGYLLIQPLEDRFAVPAEPPEKIDAIIMLGGATLGRPSSARQITELNDAGDRLTTTLWLANRYPRAKILISGGSGIMTEEEEPEAVTAQRFFIAQGVAADRLVLEGESRNTDENVANAKVLLGDDAKSLLLVTSAFHMPRSVGIFRQAGIDVIPWPTDYRTPGPQSFGVDVANPVQNMLVTTVAIKEWVGLLVYNWSGKTETLLPAP